MSPDSQELYLMGHAIDGRVLYPATGYLMLAWRALAKLRKQPYESMAVQFHNVDIQRATIMHLNSKALYHNCLDLSASWKFWMYTAPSHFLGVMFWQNAMNCEPNYIWLLMGYVPESLVTGNTH